MSKKTYDHRTKDERQRDKQNALNYKGLTREEILSMGVGHLEEQDIRTVMEQLTSNSNLNNQDI